MHAIVEQNLIRTPPLAVLAACSCWPFITLEQRDCPGEDIGKAHALTTPMLADEALEAVQQPAEGRHGTFALEGPGPLSDPRAKVP